METSLEKFKGIHPGAIIARELEKRKLSQRSFAFSLPEHPQTFNALLKGKRDLNTTLSLKIEAALGLEEGTLLTLQAFYDIRKEKLKQAQSERPDLSRLRSALFWDTDPNAIDWQRQSKAVIRRIFERGNMTEKREITRYYGIAKVRKEITPSLAHLKKKGTDS